MELRFHRELYGDASVRDAVERFASYAEITCVETPEHLVVSVHTGRAEREARIARELSNFALGLSIRARVAR